MQPIINESSDKRPCVNCGIALPSGVPEWRTYCAQCFKASAAAARDFQKTMLETKLADARAAGVDDAFLMQLITLCHPDKHANSPASIEATQRLLRMREVLRARPATVSSRWGGKKGKEE